MIKLIDYRTENALPSEMKTPERIALSYAFDVQKKKFFDRVRRVYIWADLESVSDDKLDFLAVENRVLFYSPSLAPSVKRNMIRNSIYWYMKLGTRQAMEEMIDTVFGNENTSVEEWFTYAGEPFHFRIAVGTEVTQTSIKEFLKYLNQVKDARSRFDYMVFQNGIKLVFKQISEFQSFVYTFCGEFECGTYPNTEVGFLPSKVNITLEGASDSANTVYTNAGTTPDISVGAALVENQIDFQAASEEGFSVYSSDSETESGTAPDISVGAAFTDGQIDIQAASEEGFSVYSSDSEAESGTTPDISVGGQFAEAEVDIEGESGTGSTVYQETGTAPDISVGAQFNEVQVGLEGESGTGSTVYTETGTIPDPSVGFSGTESGVSAAGESTGYDLYYNTDADKYAAEE